MEFGISSASSSSPFKGFNVSEGPDGLQLPGAVDLDKSTFERTSMASIGGTVRGIGKAVGTVKKAGGAAKKASGIVSRAWNGIKKGITALDRWLSVTDIARKIWKLGERAFGGSDDATPAAPETKPETP